MIKVNFFCKLLEPTDEERKISLYNSEDGLEFAYTNSELFHIIKEYYLKGTKIDSIRVNNSTQLSVQRRLKLLRADYGDQVLKRDSLQVIRWKFGFKTF